MLQAAQVGHIIKGTLWEGKAFPVGDEDDILSNDLTRQRDSLAGEVHAPDDQPPGGRKAQ